MTATLLVTLPLAPWRVTAQVRLAGRARFDANARPTFDRLAELDDATQARRSNRR